MLSKELDIHHLLKILLRRKWYVLIPFCLTLIAVGLYVTFAPKLYIAQTLILVERQKVPENYIKSNVTGDTNDRITSIKEQVTSRTNLESLIERFSLYSGENSHGKEQTMQEKVALMRKFTRVNVKQGSSFSISFIHSNPDKAMLVANALTDNFIKENLQIREQMSVGTTDFLESELKRVEQTLSEKETALTAYKQKHLGGLPDQLQTNLQVLNQLSQKVTSLDQSINEAHSQKILLQNSIANLVNMNTVFSADNLTGLASQDEALSSPELSQLKEELHTLLLRYTENHPDIIRLKKMIERIEKEEEQIAASAQGQIPEETTFLDSGIDMLSAQKESLKLQIDTIDQTIKDLQSEKVKVQREVERVKELIDGTPQRQLDLIELQRDYQMIQQQYNSLLSKKLESQLAENLERRHKGEQFRVIDRAKLPQKPFSPNVRRIMLVAVLMGFVVALSLTLSVEHFDQSFRDHNELSEFLQLPVLAVIPRIETAASAKRKRKLRVFTYCASAFLLLVISVGMWLWLNGNLQEFLQKIRSS
jgi:polysaccharide chain length determinant protein (PEP-CTERM system associated)